MLNAQQVRAILTQAFPQLNFEGMDYLAAGWDFEVWEVETGGPRPVLFRFPLRADCAAHVHREVALLPELAAALPVEVPQPLYTSEGCEAFGLPFFGYEKIEGTPFSEAQLADHQQSLASAEFGKLLSALHSFPIDQAVKLGIESNDANSCRERQRAFWDRCRREVLTLLSGDERLGVEATFSRYFERAEHFRYPTALLHADLGMDHVLVDAATGRVTGVIDFGDAEIGDPALDFAGMSKAVRARALDNYTRPLGDAFEERVAYFHAIGPFHDVLFGLGDGGPEHVEAGLAGIRERVLGRAPTSTDAQRSR